MSEILDCRAHGFTPDLRKFLLILMLYLIATVLFTWPLTLKLGNHVPDKGDTIIHVWKLAWARHALFSGYNFWDGTIFYPMKHSNALSDSQLGNLPFFLPVAVITGNPVLGHNVALLLTFFLGASAMFLLIYYWTGDTFASFIAGYIFGFHPFRLTALPELHMLSWQWTPLTFLFLEEFFRKAKWRDGVLAILFILWQLASSLYLGYFLAVGCVIYTIVRFFYGLYFKRVLAKGAILSILLAVISYFFLKPYIASFAQGGLERSMAWIEAGSLSLPNDLLGTYYHNILYGFTASSFGKGIPIKQYFPGLSVIFLSILGLFKFRRYSKQNTSANPHVIFGVLIFIGFIFSLGPYLIIWDKVTNVPLPYFILMKIIPGLKSIRVPSRFIFLAFPGLCLFVAIGTISTLNLFASSLKKIIAMFCIVFVLTIEFISVPIPLESLPNLNSSPPVYKWLQDADIQGGILELPFSGTQFDENYMYMYYNIDYFKPMTNGVSAFIPQQFDDLQQKFQFFPNQGLLDYLKKENITTLILHGDRVEWVDSVAAPESIEQFNREQAPWGFKYPYTGKQRGNIVIEGTAQSIHYFTKALGISSLGNWLANLGCSEIRIYNSDKFPLDTINICSMAPSDNPSAQSNQFELCSPTSYIPIMDLVSNETNIDQVNKIKNFINTDSAGLSILITPPYPYEHDRWNSNLLQQNGVFLIKTFGTDFVYHIQ